ncbi:hypothetical protein BDR05DRAFT_962135 [Suillus weaverae]|nr:hypothetical protein BDR05DRAFT_962135 [Suillus weaverae]
MSNLSESPPSLTEKLTVRKVLRAIGVGIIFLSHIINSICIGVIFTYLAVTIPALEPYAIYFAAYTFGARTVFLTCVFLAGCYWCCLRLIAPKQAGSSISEWGSKVSAHIREALNPSNGKLGRAGRTYYAATGVLSIFDGWFFGFRSWKEPDSAFRVYRPAIAVLFLICAAQLIQIAYVGRVSTKKGTRGENMAVGDNDSQPESDEVNPAGE